MTDQPQQPYQQQYDAPPPRRGAGLAIGALVLGILALLTCWTVIGGILFGLIGLVLGFIASGRAKRGRAGGRGMAITGIVLSLIGLLISIAFVAFGAAFFLNNGGGSLTDCLQKAGNDQSAQQSCQDDFRKKLENKN